MTKKAFVCGAPADISDFVAGTYEGSKNSIFPLGSLVGQGISLKITSANAFMPVFVRSDNLLGSVVQL